MKEIFILFLVLVTLELSAQEKKGSVLLPNTVFTEIQVSGTYGIWLAGSLNYSRIMTDPSKKFNLEFRGGFSRWIAWAAKGYGFTGTINLLYGKGSSHLELDLGGGFLFEPQTSYEHLLPIINIGYRYQKPPGHFLFKITAGSWGFGNLVLGYSF